MNETPSRPEAERPRGTRPATVAVVGCGHWGKNLVRNFHQLGRLEMVVDTSRGGRATARRLAPSTPVVDELDRALRASITGIAIATPAEAHAELAIRCLEAGKDVFVEKPLALDLDQGRALVEVAERLDRILMVGHVLEYHPAVVRLNQLVRDGALGEIFYIYSNRLSLGQVRREENILWSFAPHDIAVILRLVGRSPSSVVACGGSYLQPEIADMTVTNLLFSDGVRASIHVSWLHPFKEQRLVVVGSKRMLSFDDVHKRLLMYDCRVDWEEGEPVPVRAEGEAVEFPGTEPLRVECEAFLRAIETHQAPLTDGRSGLEVLTVLRAAQRSLLRDGEPVQLSEVRC